MTAERIMVAVVTHDFDPPYRRPAIAANAWHGKEIPAVEDPDRCHCGRLADHPTHNPEPAGHRRQAGVSLAVAHETRVERLDWREQRARRLAEWSGEEPEP